MEPLVFEPFLRPQVWGGRNLERFDKRLPTDGTFGESWELSSHPLHVSRVAEGPLKGVTLEQLCEQHAADLFGKAVPADGRFPLLIKLLDCQQLLSIQVHPSDELAPRLAKERLGKTEAWVILSVAPTGKVYAGLKPGTTRSEVESRVADGSLAECLHSFTPRPGDCVFLKAGTIHAVGGGVVMAEVQQSSDATFRLFDWNRLGLDGKARELHISQSLDSIDWQAGPVSPSVGTASDRPGQPTRLAECRYFTMDRYSPSVPFHPERDGGLSIWMALAGAAELRTSTYARRFQAGETVLVPASCESFTWAPLSPGTVILGIRLP